MAHNTTGPINCSLSRYLEDASRTGAGSTIGLISAVLLSFLENPGTNHQIPDYRNLIGLMEGIATQRQDGFRTELKKPCAQCPSKADCQVGNIILKG
jgi:hypothetical protein